MDVKMYASITTSINMARRWNVARMKSMRIAMAKFFLVGTRWALSNMNKKIGVKAMNPPRVGVSQVVFRMNLGARQKMKATMKAKRSSFLNSLARI